MSDQTLIAEPQAQTATPAPAPAPAPTSPAPAPSAEPQTYSRQQIMDMTHSKDPNERKKAIKYLESGGRGTEAASAPASVSQPVSQAPVAPAAPAPATAEPTAPAVASPVPAPASTQSGKFFEFSYRDKGERLPDDDGYLNRGNVDGLKKAHANQTRLIDDLQSERDRNRNAARIEAEKRAAAEKEAADLRAQLQAVQGQRAQTVRQPGAPMPLPRIDVPNEPKMPNLPEDMDEWTLEDKRANKRYLQDIAEYNAKVRQTLINVASRSVAPAGIPDDVKTEIETLKKQVETYGQHFSTIQQREEQLKQQEIEHKFWQDLDNFSQQHSEYKTSAPYREVHEQMERWKDRVAQQFGYTLAYNASPEDTQKYYQNRQAIADAYMRGDQNVLKVCEGVEPPADHRQYFKIADLSNRRQRMVQEGALGPNASMHDAYLLNMDRDGTLQQTIGRLELEQRSKGAQAVLASLQEHQTQHAATLPDSMARPPLQDTGEPTYTMDQVRQALAADARQMQKDPEIRKIREWFYKRRQNKQ